VGRLTPFTLATDVGEKPSPVTVTVSPPTPLFTELGLIERIICTVLLLVIVAGSTKVEPKIELSADAIPGMIKTLKAKIDNALNAQITDLLFIFFIC